MIANDIRFIFHKFSVEIKTQLSLVDKNFNLGKKFSWLLLDFNSISTCLGLSYALMIRSCQHYILMFAFLVQFLRIFFLHSVLWYQVFLSNTKKSSDRAITGTTNLGQGGPRSNYSEGVIQIFPDVKNWSLIIV